MTIETSVIIPCFGQARFLAEAVSSVLAQTRGPGEVLVVDDGSPDDTAEVARSFGSAVTLLRHPRNLGLSTARNTALAQARGRYLAFLDADDRWDASFLQRSLGELERSAASAGTYSRFRLIDAEGRPLGEEGEVVAPSRFRRWIADWNLPYISTVVLRAEVAAAVGPFDPHLGALEDRDYFLRLAADHVLSGVDARLVSARRHGANMSSAVARQHFYRLRLLAKHFGPLPRELGEWPRERRRPYGLAHASAATQFAAAGREEESWALLRQAAVYWPAAAADERHLWELLCGDLPRVLRSRPPADVLDRRHSGVVARLVRVAEVAPGRLRGTILGRGRLCLAWMYYGAGRRPSASRELAAALARDPSLAVQRRAIALGLRLAVGSSVLEWGRRVRRRREAPASAADAARRDAEA